MGSWWHSRGPDDREILNLEGRYAKTWDERNNFHAMLVARFAENYTMPRWAVGHYKVRYRRTADGWRMSERLEKPFMQSQTEQWGY